MQDIMLFIQHHQTLSIAFAIAITLLIVVEIIRLKRGSHQLSPAQLIQAINHQKAVVVDIRNPEAFASGHIVEAISLPLAEIENKKNKLEKYKSQPLVIACTTGADSPRAAALLVKSGFTVFILAGGIRAWKMAELPLVKG